VSRSAVVTEPVADEPGEESVIFLTLGDQLPRDTITVAAAGNTFRPGDGCSKNVLTSLPANLEVPALARLTPTAEDDFVNAGAVVLTGN
jgi:hypothetical protein